MKICATHKGANFYLQKTSSNDANPLPADLHLKHIFIFKQNILSYAVQNLQHLS